MKNMRLIVIVTALTALCGCVSPRTIPEYTEQTLHAGKYTLQVPFSGWGDTDTNLPTFWVYPCSRTKLECVPLPNSQLRQDINVDLPSGGVRTSFVRPGTAPATEVYVWHDGTNVFLSLNSSWAEEYVIETDTNGVSRIREWKEDGPAEPRRP